MEYQEENYQEEGFEELDENELEFQLDITDEEFQQDTKNEKIWYVDNEKMLSEYIEYKKLRQAALDSGKDFYPVPNYLADCFIKIANHLSYRFNFINYSYREEMVSDGIEACLRGVDSFDPARSKYIFSYYSRACFTAFVRRILKEEKQSEIKGEIISSLDVNSIVTQAQEAGEYDADFIEYMKIAKDFKVKVKPPKEGKPRKLSQVAGMLIFEDD